MSEMERAMERQLEAAAIVAKWPKWKREYQLVPRHIVRTAAAIGSERHG